METFINNTTEEGSPYDPLTCPPERLRGHLANTHLLPRVLAIVGVARWDITLCEFRGIPLNWVVKKGYEWLEHDDNRIRERIFAGDPQYTPLPERSVYLKLGLDYWSVRTYREFVVKNLMFIEQLSLAPVDWTRVVAVVPNFSKINLDIERDSSEGPFDLETILSPLS
jgi:hypothetical protein